MPRSNLLQEEWFILSSDNSFLSTNIFHPHIDNFEILAIFHLSIDDSKITIQTLERIYLV